MHKATFAHPPKNITFMLYLSIPLKRYIKYVSAFWVVTH